VTGCSIVPAIASAVSRAIAPISGVPESDFALERCTPTWNCALDCVALFCGVCAIRASVVKNTAAQRKTVLASVVMLVTCRDLKSGQTLLIADENAGPFTCRDLKSGGPHLLLMRMLGRSSDATAAAAGPST